MLQIFHGWRRKLGCVTLVLACVFTAVWIRSGHSIDYFYWRGFTNKWAGVVISGGGKCYMLPAVDLGTLTNDGPQLDESKIYLSNQPFDLGGRYFLHSIPATKVRGIFASQHDPKPAINMIPYWSIVVPLTLISAWLLLGKTRTTQIKPTTT